ncbi:MAG TPA: hypothetical protein VJS85_04565 [Rhizomicrobium sp.]|nr:hypothetical protein [Rhizomicrobium sp.]
MLKRIATGMVLAAALAGAGALFVARASPELGPVAANPVAIKVPPPGDKPFARICKSDEAVEARPSPAWVGASYAGDNCRAPSMPATIDGFTASREQVVAGMEAEKRYAAASDAFERCIQDFVMARKLQAESSGHPVNMSVAIIENHRIIASQRNRKIVTARIHTAIRNFNESGSGCEG